MPDYNELDEVIKNLSDYDWVAFTSENGIEPFCKRMLALGVDGRTIKNTRFAAFKSDALLLNKHGCKADLVPKEMSPKGIIDELVRMGVGRGRMLVPCPMVSGVREPYVVPEFIEKLESIGMTVHRLEVYHTVSIKDSGSIEKKMILKGEIDIAVFTSSAEIFSLIEQMGDRKEALNKLTIAYMGTFTAKTGKDVGLNVDIVPKRFTMQGLLEAMEDHFSN
jgi:uroporphyrinogen-III synthase